MNCQLLAAHGRHHGLPRVRRTGDLHFCADGNSSDATIKFATLAGVTAWLKAANIKTMQADEFQLMNGGGKIATNHRHGGLIPPYKASFVRDRTVRYA